MRGFFWGIALTLVAAVAGALYYAESGRIAIRGDAPPPPLETYLARHATNASIARNAPPLSNPVPAGGVDLAASATLYRDHCAACHGDPLHPVSPLASTFFPPAPQFVTEKINVPDNQSFFVIQHGVRWTGMPGWSYTLSDGQIWQLVSFLHDMGNLPPQVKQVFAANEPPMMKVPLGLTGARAKAVAVAQAAQRSADSPGFKPHK
jgi:mono/diheme cytochrome c family protein